MGQGTICSLVYDIKKQTITTLLGFSKGHWDYPGKHKCRIKQLMHLLIA